jgi:hypothetical protein
LKGYLNQKNEINKFSLECDPRLNSLLLGVKDLMKQVFGSQYILSSDSFMIFLFLSI